MTPTKTTLLAAAISIWGGLSVASAMPMVLLSIESGNIHQARVVCDQFGRCFRTKPRYREYEYRDGYRDEYRSGYRSRGGNCYAGGCCPQGMTIQDGVCQPYRGR